MYRIVLSSLLRSLVILMGSLPLVIHADDWEGYREIPQGEVIDEQTNELAAIQNTRLTGRTNLNLRDRTSYRNRDNVMRYNSPYGAYGSYGYPSSPYYGTYGYSYPSYSTYPNPYTYPSYGTYYYNPGMYNPDTTFVNPPSPMNYPTGYPGYSETYIYPR